MDKNSALASFYNFLSVIFGILGSFGIGIRGPKNVCRKKFRRKKNPKTFGRKKIEPTIFDFCPNFFRWKNQWKFKILKFWKIFEKFSKFRNFEFSLTFSSNFFSGKNKKKIGPQKNFDQTFSDFFRRKLFRPIFFSSTYFDPKFPQDSKNHT